MRVPILAYLTFQFWCFSSFADECRVPSHDELSGKDSVCGIPLCQAVIRPNMPRLPVTQTAEQADSPSWGLGLTPLDTGEGLLTDEQVNIFFETGSMLNTNAIEVAVARVWDVNQISISIVPGAIKEFEERFPHLIGLVDWMNLYERPESVICAAPDGRETVNGQVMEGISIRAQAYVARFVVYAMPTEEFYRGECDARGGSYVRARANAFDPRPADFEMVVPGNLAEGSLLVKPLFAERLSFSPSGSDNGNEPVAVCLPGATIRYAGRGQGSGGIKFNSQGELRSGQLVRILPFKELTFTPVPDAGSEFVGWGGICAGQPAICRTWSSAGENIVLAKFRRKPLKAKLQMEAGPGGSVRSARVECSQTCERELKLGAVTGVTAIAAPGYRFARWDGCDSSSGRTCRVSMSGSRRVRASFTRK